MQILKGSVVSQPSVLVHANHVSSFAPLPNMNLTKARNFLSNFFGSYGRLKSITRTRELFVQPCEKKTWAVCCIFSSSSDGNGSLAGNFDQNDEEFVNSIVIEAVKARSESDGLVIKMHDGRCLRCVHNNPRTGNLLYYPQTCRSNIKEHYEYVPLDGKIVHRQTGVLLDTTSAAKGGKWIFVMSTSKKLYAGQKKKGIFHHSSFLAGGVTVAAGRFSRLKSQLVALT